MKNVLLMLVIFLTSTSLVLAQKVKIKDLDVRAKYYEFPQTGLPKNINTYHIEVDADENALNVLGYTLSDIKKRINISGYPKSNEEVGAKLELRVKSPTGSTLKTVSNAKKNKEGKTWTEYHYTVNFTGLIAYSIYNLDGTLIKEDVVNYSEVAKSRTYQSKATLKKNFDSKKFYISNRQSALSSLLNSVNRSINYQFGFDKQDKKVEYKKLKQKKHPEYEDYLSIEKIVTDAYSKMTCQSCETFLEDMQPAIEFWTSRAPNYSATDKQEKQLKYACNLNTALTYFYAEDLDNAKVYATKVKNGKHKNKDGKKLLEKIEKLEKEFERTGYNTRHIKFEVSDAEKAIVAENEAKREAAVASGDVIAFPDFEKAMGIRSNTEVKKGKLYLKGDVVKEGYFAYDDIYKGRPDFRTKNNLRFGFDDGGNVLAIDVSFPTVDSLFIDDQRYDVMDVSVSGMLGLTIKNAVVELIHAYDRTFLMVVYPTFLNGKAFGQTSEMTPEVMILHKEINTDK